MATAEEELLVGLRRAWPGTLIVNPAVPFGAKQVGRDEAEHWLGLGAELVSFGRGGDEGYLTYTPFPYTV